MSIKLSVLYVEDEETILSIVSSFLSRKFDRVYSATNGVEGLNMFKLHTPDIIITDIQMPKMNGLQLAKEIKKISKNTPIIITTAFGEAEYLWDAIRTGINHYIAKPIDTEELLVALETVSNNILEKQELEIARKKLLGAKEREIELLRFKEKYHSQQEENAFKKQIKIISDELTRLKSGNIFCETFYKPLDILSGDSYSTLQLGEERFLFYVIDAMGKGLSASVSSIESVAFINYKAKKLLCEGAFDLDGLLCCYMDFVTPHLIEDEMVCAIFVEIDTKTNTLNYANFGAPPILVQKNNRSIHELPTNNPPIMEIFTTKNIDTIAFDDIEKLLFHSDGVDEALTKCGRQYLDFLLQDFKETLFLKPFLERFNAATQEHKDDITAIMIHNYNLDKKREFIAESTLEGIAKLQGEIIDAIAILGAHDNFVQSIKYAINEISMNALEHGNLGIPYTQKRKLTNDGIYEEFLKQKINEQGHENKKIKAYLYKNEQERGNLYVIEIEDEGSGFNYSDFFKYICFDEQVRYSGRGIIMSDSVTDGIFYNKKGSMAIICKFEAKDEGER